MALDCAMPYRGDTASIDAIDDVEAVHADTISEKRGRMELSVKRFDIPPLLRAVAGVLGKVGRVAGALCIVTLFLAAILVKPPKDALDVPIKAKLSPEEAANRVADHLAKALTFRFGAELPPEMPGFSLVAWSVTRATLEMAGMAGVAARDTRLSGCEMTTKPLTVAVDEVATRNDPALRVRAGTLKVRVLNERSYSCLPGMTMRTEEILLVQHNVYGEPEIDKMISVAADVKTS